MLSRRGFLVGLGALFAPAIVRVESIMPVKALDVFETFSPLPVGQLPKMLSLYEGLAAVTRQAFVPRLFVQMYFASPTLHMILQMEAERRVKFPELDL
jgi:hypothetical protein